MKIIEWKQYIENHLDLNGIEDLSLISNDKFRLMDVIFKGRLLGQIFETTKIGKARVMKNILLGIERIKNEPHVLGSGKFIDSETDLEMPTGISMVLTIHYMKNGDKPLIYEVHRAENQVPYDFMYVLTIQKKLVIPCETDSTTSYDGNFDCYTIDNDCPYWIFKQQNSEILTKVHSNIFVFK